MGAPFGCFPLLMQEQGARQVVPSGGRSLLGAPHCGNGSHVIMQYSGVALVNALSRQEHPQPRVDRMRRGLYLEGKGGARTPIGAGLSS